MIKNTVNTDVFFLIFVYLELIYHHEQNKRTF